MSFTKPIRALTLIASVLLVQAACSIPRTALTSPTATENLAPALPATPIATSSDADPVAGLSENVIATLKSLEKVDDHPLYTMRQYGAYIAAASPISLVARDRPPHGAESCARLAPIPWACSLFAALGNADHMLYGRNFDWQHSPALLLFTDPLDAYASVSMVDLAYLGFADDELDLLVQMTLVERQPLLQAPFLPFDGMNEAGLAVGMAAVPASEMPFDPGKPTVGSLMIIREMLDHARDVDQAIGMLRDYNINMQGGPPLHYLLADASGHSVLVEFLNGELVLFPADTAWHQATNFLRAAAGGTGRGECWRYDTIAQRLADAQGRISLSGAMSLLADVSQDHTQWSIVYDVSTGDIEVAMGRDYEELHRFHLNPSSE